MSFEIRPAEESQTSLILQFIKELAAYEKLLDKVIATEESLRKSLFGEDPKAEVIFAYYENEPIGFALFFHNYSTFHGKPGIYLEDLYVKPEMRGRGFGKNLLNYIGKLAKERDCGRVEWWVLNWNEPAIQFYKSLDAKPMDEWTVYRVEGEALDTLAETNLETAP